MRPNALTVWRRRLLRELRSNPKKARILALLVPVLILVWMPILRGTGEEQAKASVVLLPFEQPALISTRKVDLFAVERLQSRLEQREREQPLHVGERDPFASQMRIDANAEVASLNATKASTDNSPTDVDLDIERERDAASSLQLTSTFLSSAGAASARIDGHLIRSGEPFQGFLLEEVGSRWVSLRGRHGRYKLEIKRGSRGG